ncbi:iron complex outermembrane receptor protein [Sphingobium sp. OAS761]|uniref:TonB-dependent receptor n=1 Tax=Sphingobium sp. OAS761 TaxID=2817901 RepID=UPI00209FAF93|nr:TonB-dependent receptor [Sphingobium sp. OAS761]MCP1471302.1 iron complex outermembrane receptor protein [Sphingobium sp. OAS761]
MLAASTVAIAASVPAFANADVADQPQAASVERGADDIVVTARRKEESIQSVPVAVQAFSSETLIKLNVHDTKDLQRLVPGVVFNGSGSELNTTFTIRGQGRAVVGTISPSVQSYVNEVALPNWGAVIPTYDVANVQVLKGPQGTLFGRNTTGGAVLVYSQAPQYDFGGYASATLGDYSWHEVEGAINAPLVQEKVALRVAGQYRKRDGYIRAGVLGQPDGQGLNSRAFRVSLLVEPVDGVKNTTVYDYFWSDTAEVQTPTELSNGVTLDTLPFPPAAIPFFKPIIQGILDRQKAVGPYVYFSDLVQRAHAQIQGLTNTTELNLGDFNVKNIFGYRKSRISNISNTTASEYNFTGCYLCAHADDQISDELQVSTSALQDTMSILLGGFYLRNKPKGVNALGLAFTTAKNLTIDEMRAGGVMMDQQDDSSTKAIFLSIGQKLDSVLPGLKLNLSGRYTWDQSSTCADGRAGTATPYSSFESCIASPTSSTPKSKFKKFTWSAGLDYQATPDLFFYGVARTGYRAGGANTPILGASLQPYQTFAPQTVTDFEIGVKADYSIAGARARTNISAYASKYKSLQLSASGIPPGIDGDTDPLNDPTFASLNLNVGSAVARGVEIDGFITPIENLRLSYAGSYFYGKIDYAPIGIGAIDTSNPRFNYAPSTSVTLAADYSVPDVLGGDLNFNVNWYRISNFRVDRAQNAGYNLLNASVELGNIAGSGLTVQLFGQNLTNRAYYLNPNSTGNFPGYQTWTAGAPRMYGVRATYRFGGN